MAEDFDFTISDQLSPEGPTEKRSGRVLVDRIIDVLLHLAEAHFWSDPHGVAYATITYRGRTSRHEVDSPDFKKIIRYIWGKANPVVGKHATHLGSLPDAAVNEVISTLEAMALDGPRRRPEVRVLEHEGAIWLDLGTDDCGLIRITGEGWEHVKGADVPLVRRGGLEALPLPEDDPSALLNLRKLINVKSDVDFKLIVAWLVAVLIPGPPCAMLALLGEGGSAKTTAARALRRLVDPNEMDVRMRARNVDDLIIAARGGRVLAFDNLSAFSTSDMDEFCQLVTGAGFGKRKNYSDLDEIIVSVRRPLMLNSTANLLTRPDFASRAISIVVPSIPEEERLTETEFWAAFTAAAPGILAHLLDGAVMALQRFATVKLPRLPRMADFAKIACAAAPAFGWTEIEMLEALAKNGAAVVAGLMEEDTVAEAVLKLANEISPKFWHGAPTELLATLNKAASEDTRNERSWPRAADKLSARLKQIKDPLRACGEIIESRRP